MVAAGAGAVFIASPSNGASTQVASLADVALGAQYNLTVQVGAVVEGAAIPITGANVTIWSYNLNETNDSVTLTFTKVANGTTDASGDVSFSLPPGDYIVVSSYSGLRSINFVSLQSDVSGLVLLHNPLAPVGHGGVRERLHEGLRMPRPTSTTA